MEGSLHCCAEAFLGCRPERAGRDAEGLLSATKRALRFAGAQGTFRTEAALAQRTAHDSTETTMAKAARKLDDLFHDTLKDIYFAEKKILSALPKMAKAAQDDKLRAAFEKHRGETEGHVTRLEQVFEAIDAKPQGKTCDAIMGIIEEASRSWRSRRARPRSTPACWRRRKRWSTTRSRATARCGRGRRSSACRMPRSCWKPR